MGIFTGVRMIQITRNNVGIHHKSQQRRFYSPDSGRTLTIPSMKEHEEEVASTTFTERVMDRESCIKEVVTSI